MIALALCLTFQTIQSPVLVRKYEPDEPFYYEMTGTNKDADGTRHYSAMASGQVISGAEGNCFEWIGWGNLTSNGTPVDLPHASQAFREVLSLDPSYQAPLPDLSKVVPELIGPVTDLLTFYADLRLAMRQTKLTKVGTHVYVKYGLPASWADGQHVLFGEDSIDFDLTLTAVDPDDHFATLVVKHVPPSRSFITAPAEWMKQPAVGDTPNNWMQVTQQEDGSYLAGVGKETFDVQLKVSLIDGSILSAKENNVVDIVERTCQDQSLLNPGPPKKSRIVRTITLDRWAPID